jgi:hypothetical protein
MTTVESLEASDIADVRSCLNQLMRDQERWQVIATALHPTAATIVASGIWPDVASLDELLE